MALSEHERRILDEMWADLPPLRISRTLRLRIGLSRAARHVGPRLRHAFPALAVLVVGAGMVVFAGLLFANGYAAGTAAVSAGATGLILGTMHRRRNAAERGPRGNVGSRAAGREANRDR